MKFKKKEKWKPDITWEGPIGTWKKPRGNVWLMMKELIVSTRTHCKASNYIKFDVLRTETIPTKDELVQIVDFSQYEDRDGKRIVSITLLAPPPPGFEASEEEIDMIIEMNNPAYKNYYDGLLFKIHDYKEKTSKWDWVSSREGDMKFKHDFD